MGKFIMKRELFGEIIEQRTSDSFFNLTALLRIGNKWRTDNKLSQIDVKMYLHNDRNKEFIKHLTAKYGIVYIAGRGRGNFSWCHPMLFIDIALWISPQLKLSVYEWLFDLLIEYRNDSCESYKYMCGALYTNCTNKATFHKYIINIGYEIKKACGINDWDDWQIDNKELLKKRNDIHMAIASIAGVLRDNDQAVELGIKQINNMACYKEKQIANK